MYFQDREAALQIGAVEDHLAIEAAGDVYVKADRVIGIYGMGLTQHAHGFLNVAMFVNLLLLKGNIGRDGTGISPVRGHSNVQGQRTVGITEKPELVPLDRYAAQFGFDPPRDKGMNTVETCEGLRAGKVVTADDKKYAGFMPLLGDPLPYGVKDNLPSIKTMIDYTYQQGMIPRKFSVEEAFVNL